MLIPGKQINIKAKGIMFFYKRRDQHRCTQMRGKATIKLPGDVCRTNQIRKDFLLQAR